MNVPQHAISLGDHVNRALLQPSPSAPCRLGSMPGTRVVPVFDPRGVPTLAVALGSTLGATIAFTIAELGNPANVHWALALGVHFAPAAVFSCVLLAVTQKWRSVFPSVWLFAFSQLIVGDLASTILSPYDRGASLGAYGFIGDAVQIFGVALLVAGLAVLSLYLARWCIVVLVEQTGLLCWNCAYDTGSASIARCPECGASIDPTRFRYGPLASSLRWLSRCSGRILLAVMVLLLTAAGLTMNHQGTIAASRFADRFWFPPTRPILSSPERMMAGTIRDPARTGPFAYFTCLGAWVPIDENTGQGVAVSYLPAARPGVPAMQLRLMILNKRPAGDYYSESSPPVSCSLDRGPAEWVVRHGVPASLLTAMKDAARNAPPAPPSGPRTAVIVECAEFVPADGVDREP